MRHKCRSQEALADVKRVLRRPLATVKLLLRRPLATVKRVRGRSFHRLCSSLVGFLTLRTPARLDQTVCLLCLPPPDRDYSGHNCTVTGYGRPGLRGRTDYWSDTTTDGILREAHLAVRGDGGRDAACRDLWGQEEVPGRGPGPEGRRGVRETKKPAT